tara:strand:- start:420 stop:683 length:264 start_codon:yes stop_codon:yes gene_type:complete
LNGLDSQIKGFLYFLGSLFQWPPKKPQEFLIFHAYIVFIYAIHSITGLGLFLVVGALGPICLAIFRGLPLDCLSYESAILREFSKTE